MIKCPHCGSTAQVKQESGNTYSCGCGCWFTIIKVKDQEEKEKPSCPNCGDNKSVYPSFDNRFNYECDYCGAKF